MQPKEGLLKKYYPVILLTVVILASVVVLSFTNSFASVQIEAQIQSEKLSQLKAMFPDMTAFTTAANGIDIIKVGDKTIGYSFTAIGKGYGGTIIILVGLQDANTVKGISIVAQTETNGLGSRVTRPEFTDQFSGKAIADIQYSGKAIGSVKSEQIDGWSGSTISSKAVINAVRETAMQKVAQLPK